MPASKYDIEVDLGAEGTSHRFMVELIGSNKAVLDVGCATGYLAKTLNAFGNTVSGIEYEPAAAAVAAEHLKRVVVADLDNVDMSTAFDGATFDVIVFGDVLEHLRDPLPPLRQARRMLRPGGYIVISIPNVAHGDVRMSLLAGRFRYTNVGLLDNTHLRFFTRDTLAELLSDAGFVALEVRTTRAPLFGTELRVRPEDVSPDVVRQLEQDPDSTVYQFVLTAAPDDSTTLEKRTAWQLQENGVALERTRSQLSAAQSELGTLRQELEAERARTAGLTADAAALAGELAAAQAAVGAAERQAREAAAPAAQQQQRPSLRRRIVRRLLGPG
jgi:O-antigen biosynthesis protein